MGNGHSKHAETAFQELLSQFSHNENAFLLQNYDSMVSSDTDSALKHTAQKPATISLSSFMQHFPPMVTENLKKGFAQFFEMCSANAAGPTGKHQRTHSKQHEKLTLAPPSAHTITKLGYMYGVHKLTKTGQDEQAEAAYAIAQLAHGGSLMAFVQDVTCAALSYWFDGANATQARSAQDRASMWQHLQGDGQLIELLCLAPLIRRGEVEDVVEENLFLNNCRKQGYFVLDQFVSWFTSNLKFQHLFNVLVRQLFLDCPCPKGLSETDLKALRLQNKIAPEVKSPYPCSSLSRLISPADYFVLCNNLPPECRTEIPHTLLFSSAKDGDSWSTMINSILYKGSTLLIVRDKHNYVFGGFTYEDWEPQSHFYGNDKNFLFTIRPKLRRYTSSRYNDHYQYLDYGTQTLPNGIGLGGQLDYFGLWISCNFNRGHSKACPLSTTYANPRLSKEEEFEVDEIEIWLVRPTDREPDELPQGPKISILDSNVAELEIMEMATGRKAYSKEVREPEILA